jgi:hypothetical protein
MRAVPSPRPDAPPVTMKTLPAISMLFSCLCVGRDYRGASRRHKKSPDASIGA